MSNLIIICFSCIPTDSYYVCVFCVPFCYTYSIRFVPIWYYQVNRSVFVSCWTKSFFILFRCRYASCFVSKQKYAYNHRPVGKKTYRCKMKYGENKNYSRIKLIQMCCWCFRCDGLSVDCMSLLIEIWNSFEMINCVFDVEIAFAKFTQQQYSSSSSSNTVNLPKKVIKFLEYSNNCRNLQ